MSNNIFLYFSINKKSIAVPYEVAREIDCKVCSNHFLGHFCSNAESVCTVLASEGEALLRQRRHKYR